MGNKYMDVKKLIKLFKLKPEKALYKKLTLYILLPRPR